MAGFPAVRVGRLRVDRLALLLVAAALGLTALAGALASGLGLVRPGALPGIEVAGVDVGGLREGELRAAVSALAGERGRERIRVVRPAAAGRPRVVSSSTRAAMGYRLDVAATVEAVLARGRGANPFVSLWDHARAFFATTGVEPVERVEGSRLARWAEKTATTLSITPREGDLKIEGTSVEAIYPAPGAVVEASALARRARTALLDDRRELTVSPENVAPATDAAAVDRVAAEAEAALAGPVVLARGPARLSFSAQEIGRALDVREADGELQLRIRPRRLRGAVSAEERAAVESDPVDASFRLGAAGVEIVPSRPGFTMAPKKTARTVLKVATSAGERRGELPGRIVPPEFTTRDARALRIREQVSSFTTYHACCEPRVTNIHRIADLVDGVVVPPDETFSLNGHVGPRTTTKGFVAAPSIRDGEFVDEVGGGISQFATTMFNAIYFGGYDFLEYQPHSYYIDRYPMGREATISTPAPDLAFRNDSGAGIYIDTSYTDTSITVTFYGNTDVEVRSETGEPYNRKGPREECRENKDLRRGEERVISEGRAGFDVVVRRILIRDGNRTVERFFTRYNSEPRIIERRRCRGS